MFLRFTQRERNVKTHVCWNVVETERLAYGGVVQRQVLYL